MVGFSRARKILSVRVVAYSDPSMPARLASPIILRTAESVVFDIICRRWASNRIRTTEHAKPRQVLKTNSFIVLLQTVTAYGVVAFVCRSIDMWPSKRALKSKFCRDP
jgi:hypothetical protein